MKTPAGDAQRWTLHGTEPTLYSCSLQGKLRLLPKQPSAGVLPPFFSMLGAPPL